MSKTQFNLKPEISDLSNAKQPAPNSKLKLAKRGSRLLILFGGTFDPVHNGHLLLAQKLYSSFEQIVTFLPVGIPPYKPIPQTTNEQRLDMLKLALDNDYRYVIDLRELYSFNYNYTYQTLRQIRQELGEYAAIFFLIGSDSLVTLDTWENWQELLTLTNFVVAMRPDYNLDQMSPILAKEFNKRKRAKLESFTCSGSFYLLDFAPLNISSTQIRNLVSDGQSVNHLVNKCVAKYILKHNLYRK